MNLDQLIKFLIKFNVERKIIEEFLKDKQIIQINKNYFLINKNTKIKTDQVYTDKLIFIQLNNLLPSKFLLNIIKKNTKNIIEVKSEKQALEYTYSKSLSFASIKNKYQLKFKEEEYYLIEYENQILGYFQYNPNHKTHPIKNIFNIGEYLHEN